MDTWLWIVIAVVALVVIGALAAFGVRKKQDRDRKEAAALRSDAEQREPQLRKQDAETRGIEAEAERERAEAEQLEAQARERRERLEAERGKVGEQFREADERDPDTDTK